MTSPRADLLSEMGDRTLTSPGPAAATSGVVRLRYLGIALIADRVPTAVERAPAGWFLGASGCIVGRNPGLEGVRLDDPEISRCHFAVEWGGDGFHIKDLGSHNGTFVDGVALESPRALRSGMVIRAGGTVLVYEEMALCEGIDSVAPRRGVSIARTQVEALADLVASKATPVLITGPTGSGKERLVERLHAGSRRSGKLVAVNCANFSRELLGSELFGHVAGAFSGASSGRAGLIRSADRGTLFLDEIADLPLDQQAALLRVLQEQRVRPVGSDLEHAVDVRVVAATHQNLEELLKTGAFRADLYARLAGLSLRVPPLSDRRVEILDLFTQFFAAPEVVFQREAAEALLLYDWPLNVRELKSVAENARLFLGDASAISLAVFPEAIRSGGASSSSDLPQAPVDLEAAEAVLPPEQIPGAPARADLSSMLDTHGSVAAVARALGKHRMQIYRWLKAYQLERSVEPGAERGLERDVRES